MTTVESFQVVAALGAAAGVLALMMPGRPATARRAGGLAVLVASWFLLVGSLVSRDDLDALWNRVDSPARLAVLGVATLAGAAATILLVRLAIRRPGALFVMLAVALPIRVPISLGGERGGNLLLPLYWVIAIGLIAMVWMRFRRDPRGPTGRATPLDIPLAAFAAFSLTSTLWSSDINEAAIKGAFFYVPFVLLFFLVVHWWPLITNPLRVLGDTTLAIAGAVALVAIGQFATRTIWWNDTLQQGNVYNRFFRVNGIFYDPNILGRYLMVALIIGTAYAWLTQRTRNLAILGGLGVVLAAGLAVTFSRSSALGLMVAIALLAFRAFGAKRTLAVGIGLLLLVGLPVVAINENVRDKVTSAERLAGTGEGRFRLAKGGVELWKTAPVVGVGLGAFSEEYRQTLPRKQQLRTRVVISHTAPVTVLAELGVLGFGLFAVLCVWTLVALARAARAARPDGWSEWTILAILVAIFVHALLYSALFEDPFVWTLAAAGVAVAAARTAREPNSEAASEPDPTRPVAAPAEAG